MTSYVAKRRYQLVELQICSRTTYFLNSKVPVPKVFNEVIYLGISLTDKLDPCQLGSEGGKMETYGSEEVMQSIFAYCLLILLMLA